MAQAVSLEERCFTARMLQREAEVRVPISLVVRAFLAWRERASQGHLLVPQVSKPLVGKVATCSSTMHIFAIRRSNKVFVVICRKMPHPEPGMKWRSCLMGLRESRQSQRSEFLFHELRLTGSPGFVVWDMTRLIYRLLLLRAFLIV